MQQPSRPVNPIQTIDPFRRHVEFVFGHALHLRFRWHTPRVMGLVVNHDQVSGRRHLVKNFAHIRFVALGSSFVDAATPRDLFVRVPTQFVPVVYHDRRLS